MFDSSPLGPNAGGPDPDLLVGRGHLLILQARAEEARPGVFAVPDDFAGGGTLRLELLVPSRLLSIELVDVDGPPFGEGTTVRLVVRSGFTRTYEIDAG